MPNNRSNAIVKSVGRRPDSQSHNAIKHQPKPNANTGFSGAGHRVTDTKPVKLFDVNEGRQAGMNFNTSSAKFVGGVLALGVFASSFKVANACGPLPAVPVIGPNIDPNPNCETTPVPRIFIFPPAYFQQEPARFGASWGTRYCDSNGVYGTLTGSHTFAPIYSGAASIETIEDACRDYATLCATYRAPCTTAPPTTQPPTLPPTTQAPTEPPTNASVITSSAASLATSTLILASSATSSASPEPTNAPTVGTQPNTPDTGQKVPTPTAGPNASAIVGGVIGAAIGGSLVVVGGLSGKVIHDQCASKKKQRVIFEEPITLRQLEARVEAAKEPPTYEEAVSEI